VGAPVPTGTELGLGVGDVVAGVGALEPDGRRGVEPCVGGELVGVGDAEVAGGAEDGGGAGLLEDGSGVDVDAGAGGGAGACRVAAPGSGRMRK
jgi:hypothetical protein